VAIGSGTYNSALTSGTDFLWILEWIFGMDIEITSCYFSSALVYDRALSATEVEQNFNATRSRYGI
jgi:hypothetical protein